MMIRFDLGYRIEATLFINKLEEDFST